MGEHWAGDGSDVARVAGDGIDAEEVASVEEVTAVGDPPLPRNRWNIVLAVVCVVLLLAAGGVALRNRSVGTEAAARRDDAAELDRQRDEVAAQLEQDQAKRAALIVLSDHVDHDLGMLVTAVNDRVIDHRNVVDLERDAVAKSNDGDESAARDLFQSKGQALLDDLRTAAEFLATERAELDADIQHLKESSGA